MNSKEFLKSKLFALSAVYPATVIKYFFDAFDNDHFICIHPRKDLEAIWQHEARTIDREFITKFPAESLSFIEIDENLQFDELVYAIWPSPVVESKKVNISLVPSRSYQHHFQITPYTSDLTVIKIEKEALIVEKEEDEFAFAA